MGRLVRNHDGTGNTIVVFHSVVGGGMQDALFGIAEINADEFVVVGETSEAAGATPSSVFTFPLTPALAGCVNFNAQATSTVYSTDPMLAVVLHFDASLTRLPAVPGNDLVLVASRLIGTNPVPANEWPGITQARDVAVVDGQIFVVGTTDDQGLPVAGAFQATLLGVSGGFVARTTPQLLSVLPGGFAALSYHGNATECGLVGIAAWSEYPDHVALAGFEGAVATRDIVVASVLSDTSAGNAPFHPLALVREVRVGGDGAEHPAFQRRFTGGATTAFNQMPSYNGRLLNDFGGGGISVDQRFRLDVVGGTRAGVPAGVLAGNPYLGGTDGVIVTIDLLPGGVCRTDGTGECPGAPTPSGLGTTTPVCALSPFGRLVSLPAQPAAEQDRILIDFLGSNAAGTTNAALVLDRPPPSFVLEGVFLQLGFLSNPPLVHQTVEIWTQANPLFFAQFPAPGTSIRFPLGTLPSGPGQVTAQFVCIGAPACCLPPNPAACLVPSGLRASPALTFTW